MATSNFKHTQDPHLHFRLVWQLALHLTQSSVPCYCSAPSPQTCSAHACASGLSAGHALSVLAVRLWLVCRPSTLNACCAPLACLQARTLHACCAPWHAKQTCYAQAAQEIAHSPSCSACATGKLVQAVQACPKRKQLFVRKAHPFTARSQRLLICRPPLMSSLHQMLQSLSQG